MAWNVEHILLETRLKIPVPFRKLVCPHLPFPYSSGIDGSKHSHMRELRVQSGGRPIRVFYAFDPRRTAILLLGGEKTGDDRFYERGIPIADALYDTYINEIRKEGLIP